MIVQYTVPSDFSVDTLVAACAAAGVKLQGDDDVPNPCGWAVLTNTDLRVLLNNDTAPRRAIVDAAVVAQGGSRT